MHTSELSQKITIQVINYFTHYTTQDRDSKVSSIYVLLLKLNLPETVCLPLAVEKEKLKKSEVILHKRKSHSKEVKV